jgi:Zn-dependent peptidase ImmA (M78 family)
MGDRKRVLPALLHRTYAQILTDADNLDVSIVNAPLPDDITGIYDETARLILIDQRLISAQQRCTLVHELVHWEHADDTCQGSIGTRMERRTRRETASRLVDPCEYAIAESEYEGDTYAIACELDVTVQIIEDFRKSLGTVPVTRSRRRASFCRA